MKKFVLTIVALTFAASPALAQYGDISAYNDQGGASCNVADVGAAVHDVFIVLKHNTGGVTAARFKVENGTAMSQIGEQAAPGTLTIGTAAAGIDVAFTTCQPFDAYLMKVTYFGTGTSTPCSYISVLAHPGSQVPGETVIVDCTQPFGIVRAVPKGQAIVNPGAPPAQCDCTVAAANESTWGSIKALYR